MATFAQLLSTDKNFTGNVIVRFLGEYFSLRDCDSGLTIKPQFSGLVSSLVTNPTTVDPRRISTTIASNSVRLLDLNGIISSLVRDTGQALVGQAVDIWIGRTGVGLDFADYFQLPATNILKITHIDNSYTFNCVESTNRMNKPIYQQVTRVDGDIFFTTTDIACKDAIDAFPTAGTLKIDNEFLSYTSKDDTAKTFSGISRGLYATTAVDHSDAASIQLADVIVDNPLSIILRLLLSGGGGSSYDNLSSGLGIDQSLIDITAIETLRDAFFSSVSFQFAIYDTQVNTDALSFIEDNLLFPNRLRFTFSSSSKITLTVIDQAKFVPDSNVVNEDTLTQYPKSDIDGSKVVNNIQISWDYDENAGNFNQITTLTDTASIAAYGLSSQLTFSWYGVKASLGGAAFVQAFATRFFARMSTPNPEIDVSTQLDKGQMNVGDSARLTSTQVANADGILKFDSDLEVISRSINWQTGDVTMKLAFTSFTGVRTCYLAPADTIVSIMSQKIVTMGAGVGALYTAGWAMLLWNNVTGDYESDAVNYISDVTGDVITFLNDWSTTLTTHHRLKFADFKDVVGSQKRYCFISATGLDFSPAEKSYKVAS